MNKKIDQLMESGAHLGYKTSMWNPKMSQYIYDEKEDIHIIDLKKTEEQIFFATQEILKHYSRGKSILFVGTKNQAKQHIEKFAQKIEMPYVTNRWTGGMLTNLTTTKKSIRKIKETEEGILNENASKKERLILERLLNKLKRNFASLTGMKKLPTLMFVVDPIHDHIAVAEANKLNIPVIAICDTNADPDKISITIPANVCSEKSISKILEMITEQLPNTKHIETQKLQYL